ncbi:DUF6542 domain-containing protein [Streptomyces sp. BBFR102]|uniref:DUF6542 domain-containing protein n=1 Tax=Streptomyces sp. BBFR102 TaxID=3448171 RepID=UPI003F52E48D
MEQPSTPAQQTRRPAPLPAQGAPADSRPPAAPGPRRGQEAPRAVRPRPTRPERPGLGPAARARAGVRRMPRPRLTGLGAGLLSTAAMVVAGALAWLLPAGAQTVVFGVLFLPVCALTALWVRPADLAMGPVVVPLAYAVGVLPVAEGGGGFIGQVMGLVTTLALNAGWLYGGTLVAGVIATVRKVRAMGAARRKGRAAAPGRPAARAAEPRTAPESGEGGRRAAGSRVAP